MKNNRLSASKRRVAASRQGGAIAVWFGIMLVALVAAIAAAIDIGRLYTAQRTLQKQANLAALDAARVVARCSSDGAPGSGDITAAAQASLARNGADDPNASFSTWSVEPGRVGTDTETNFRIFTGSAVSDADAVRVTLRRAVPSRILPMFQQGSGELTAAATATQSALGSLRVGSTLAGVQDGIINALLSALLGGEVDIGVAGYEGLLGVNLTLEQLALALGLTVQDLSDPLALETATPILSDVINNLASDLSGMVSTEVRNALQELAGETTNNSPIPLGDVLRPVGDIAKDVPFVNLGELITALAMATHADPDGNASPIPLDISVGIPGVTSINSFLQILEPPQLSGLGRPGETRADTAQVRLMLRLELDLASNIVAALNPILRTVGLFGILYRHDPLAVDPIKLGIDLEVSPSSAYLDQIDCPRNDVNDGYPQAWLSASMAVADVSLGTFTGDAATAPELATGRAPLTAVRLTNVCAVLCLVPLGSLTLNVDFDEPSPMTVPVGDNSIRELPLAVTDFTRITGLPAGTPPAYRAEGIPPQTPVAANPQTVGSGQLLGSALGGLTANLNLDAEPDPSSSSGVLNLVSSILSLLLDTLIDTIKTALGPILTGLGGVVDALLDPVLRLLGVEVGRATVIMDTVTIDRPRLVTLEVPAADE